MCSIFGVLELRQDPKTIRKMALQAVETDAPPRTGLEWNLYG